MIVFLKYNYCFTIPSKKKKKKSYKVLVLDKSIKSSESNHLIDLFHVLKIKHQNRTNYKLVRTLMAVIEDCDRLIKTYYDWLKTRVTVSHFARTAIIFASRTLTCTGLMKKEK